MSKYTQNTTFLTTPFSKVMVCYGLSLLSHIFHICMEFWVLFFQSISETKYETVYIMLLALLGIHFSSSYIVLMCDFCFLLIVDILFGSDIII